MATDLDPLLDRQHTIAVEIDERGSLPDDNQNYNPIRNLANNGITFTPRRLLHAIGSKTAALPMNEEDECLKSAHLYTHILDFNSPNIRFNPAFDSDLQAPRSQEIGIAMMCLLAYQCFGIPWDQLGPIPGRGKRFDYRGIINGINCIFESKGTKYRGNQNGQIGHGLEKKEAHHQRGEFFDIELIISTYIGQGDETPRILLADPDEDSLKELFGKGDNIFYRLRHYTRVMQFAGLTPQAYQLNKYAYSHLKSKEPHRQWKEKWRFEDFPSKQIICNNELFIGNWYRDWIPEKSKRYERLYKRTETSRKIHKKWKVFQGIKKNVYDNIFFGDLTSIKQMSDEECKIFTKSEHDIAVSVFPDGSILAIDYM